VERTVEDAFERALELEARAHASGREEGARAGRALGTEEGRELGFAKGFEVAEEVGFYAGCAAVWERCAREGGEAYGERVERMIGSFRRACETSALSNPLDEGILERVERLRGRFKTLVALLGVRAEYATRGGAASGGLSF